MSNWDVNTISYDDFLASSNTYLAGEEEQVSVKFFTNEKSIRLCLLKNQRFSLPIRLLYLIIKTLPCILYVIQVMNDDPKRTDGCCHICENHTLKVHVDEADADIAVVHWERLIYVNRKYELWIAQIIFSILSLCQQIMMSFYVNRGSMMHISFFVDVTIELMNSIPFIVSIFYSVKLRCLFIPTFLNCWIAKTQFEDVLGDLNRVLHGTAPPFFHRVMKVISSTFCLIFTSICGFQHLQRGGYKHVSLFESLWFVVVTFSTVGYGDYKPDIWLSQAFMIGMIVVGLIVIPVELERLGHVWLEKNKLGGTYSHYRSKREKHVVLCTMSITTDIIMDFLNEFFAHQVLQDYCVCLLSPSELDSTMKIFLQMPIWSQRVIYLQGSPFKDIDLVRCRIQDSQACFILAPNTFDDTNQADQQTIMRSWAIKDFAPNCRQLVQLYRPENQMYVKFAEQVVCIDEFKYALLGKNVLVPGISTLVTLLIHTSKGREGQECSEDWQKLYGKCSGNEIYSIKLSDSKFFREFENKSFSFASYHAYRKYGINLVAISTGKTNKLQLNPGPQHMMSIDDMCYYLSITEEGNSSVVTGSPKPQKYSINPRQLTHMYSEDHDVKTTSCGTPTAIDINCVHELEENEEISFAYQGKSSKLRVGYPPKLPFIGNCCSVCHMLTVKRNQCCQQLLTTCEHCPLRRVMDYKWRCKSVIFCAETISFGVYNFIVSLRSHTISARELKPIVILVKENPDPCFLESITHFPLVYWMLGSYERIDDLLKAGIICADRLVLVVNREWDRTCKQDNITDCNTILAAQKIHVFFPHVRVITEISQCQNMKFTLFSPDDQNSLKLSKLEKKERALGSHISYIFSQPFAAGNVFCTNMLDTLLYQAFVKPYLITFFKLLLGIEQSTNSGYFTTYQIRENDIMVGKKYGWLYKTLKSKSFQIPIGIYRTTHRNKTLKEEEQREYEVKELNEIVQNRLSALNIPLIDYVHTEKDYYSTSFVVVNPGYDEELKLDDIIYLISAPIQTSTIINRPSDSKCSSSYHDDYLPINENNCTYSKENGGLSQGFDIRKQSAYSIFDQSTYRRESHDSEGYPLVRVIKNQ